jgi:hypothetical protein
MSFAVFSGCPELDGFYNQTHLTTCGDAMQTCGSSCPFLLAVYNLQIMQEVQYTLKPMPRILPSQTGQIRPWIFLFYDGLLSLAEFPFLMHEVNSFQLPHQESVQMGQNTLKGMLLLHHPCASYYVGHVSSLTLAAETI